MTRTFKRLSVLLLATVAVAGCSTLNPYVDAQMRRPGFDAPSGVERALGVRTAASEVPATVSIAQVRQYARSLHNAYVNAVAQQERLNSGAQLSLIPLAATAVGLGITGGSSEAITALGLTGAGITVAGTVAVNEERQRIYLAGASALTCIQDLANQFEAATTDRVFQIGPQLNVAIARLGDGLEGLAGALESNDDDVLAAQAAVAIARSEETLSEAYALRQFISIPGQILLYRVDEIQDLVNRLIQGTSVDLTTFASTLTPRLASLSGAAGGADRSLATVVPEEPDRNDVQGWLDVVQSAERVLATVVARSAVDLELVDRSCITDFPNTSNPLSVSPPTGITGPAENSFTANLIVSGGTPPYGIIPSEGVDVEQRTPMGRSRERFDLTMDASASFAPIMIFDANDRQDPISVPVSRGQ